jgi:16S rRNA (cytosine1402-N4)-methyltransferase
LYVDGTTGGGGHAAAISSRLSDGGQILCLDADDEALAEADRRIGTRSGVAFRQANFSDLKRAVEEFSSRKPHGILLDLGVSSHQLDDARRGFTFRDDAPLDMRFDRRQTFSALDVVNGYDHETLSGVIHRYGEERAARSIARNIVSLRPVTTTRLLASAVEGAVGARHLVKSLARVFQAIRIEVNGELDALTKVLADGIDILAPQGRIAVIAYHSLEDRIVKTTFKSLAATSMRSTVKLVPDTILTPTVRLVSRHAIVPDDEECRRNPRARSAKLRVAEKIGR